MTKITITLALLFTACALPVEGTTHALTLDRNGDPLFNQCDPEEDLRLDAEGTIIHGISQCAICARIEAAYDAAAARLGCAEAFPFNGCPLDEGRTDCLIWQVDLEIEHLNTLATCADLQQRTGQRNSYTGFECGSTCRWSDGFANFETTSTLPQNDPIQFGQPATFHNACEFGTPYVDRLHPR